MAEEIHLQKEFIPLDSLGSTIVQNFDWPFVMEK